MQLIRPGGPSPSFVLLAVLLDQRDEVGMRGRVCQSGIRVDVRVEPRQRGYGKEDGVFEGHN